MSSVVIFLLGVITALVVVFILDVMEIRNIKREVDEIQRDIQRRLEATIEKRKEEYKKRRDEE